MGFILAECARGNENANKEVDMKIICPKCGSTHIGQLSNGKANDQHKLPTNSTQYVCADCGFIVGKWENGVIILNKYNNEE